jgi:hypothetical protein
VNLGKTRVPKQGPVTVRFPCGGYIRTHGVGREVKDIAVTSGGQNHRVGRMPFELPGDQVLGNNAPGFAIHGHQFHHFVAAVHGHLLFGNLTVQGRIGPQQQLLPGLTAGIERTGYLGSSKRTVVQHSTVIPGKRHTLRNALIDDGGTDFGQTMHIGFAGSVIPPLDGIIEKTSRPSLRRFGNFWPR